MGEAYLNAYKLEASINTAAIHVDDKIIKELSIENKKLIFKFKEPFPKNNENREKYFLISDMNNYDVPQTLLYNISRQISKLSNDQTNKFLNTFCLYYSVMVKQHEDTNNLKKYNEWWIDILNRLSNTGITSG